jgi:hypothetical protein
MVSPISGYVGKIFLQVFEHKIIKHTLGKKSILFYISYVDDIWCYMTVSF